MSVQNIAQKFIDGLYEECNGLGVHDAVHVLATRYGVSKPELRAAIYGLYKDEIVVPIEEPIIEEAPNESFDG